MQTKGKKKIIDNAGALQKKYAWKSEKTQDTKKAPQDTKKQAAVCPYAKKCGGCDYQGMSYEQQLQEKQNLCAQNIGDYCKSCRSSEWKIRIITEIKYTQCLMWSGRETCKRRQTYRRKRTCKGGTGRRDLRCIQGRNP